MVRSLYLGSVFLVAFLLGGCASKSSSVPSPSYVPSRFKASIGGFLGDSYTVEFFSPATLRYTHTSRGALVETVDIDFEPELWADVFFQLENAGVYQWRSRYVRSGVRDGTRWSLEYETPARRQTIWGDNRFPDYGEFREFLGLLSDMVDGRKFE